MKISITNAIDATFIYLAYKKKKKTANKHGANISEIRSSMNNSDLFFCNFRCSHNKFDEAAGTENKGFQGAKMNVSLNFTECLSMIIFRYCNVVVVFHHQ